MFKKLLAIALGALATPAIAHEDLRFDHIFVIMMENHGTGEIIGNKVDAPFINDLAMHSRVAMNYYGVTHPSLPNYLSLISGSHQGIWDDCKAGQASVCAPEEFVVGSGDATDGTYLSPAQIASATATPHWFSGKTIVDQLKGKGLTWKAYMQSMPKGGHDVEYAPVVNGATVKLYAQKHNPFEYFASTHGAAEIVPFEGNFAADLYSRKVANFVFIAPDQCHDMHGVSPSSATLVQIPTCGYPNAGLDHGAIQLGDAFLKDTINAIVKSPVWGAKSAIVVVWDEDDYSGFAGCCQSPKGDGLVGSSGQKFVLGGARAPAMVVTQKSLSAPVGQPNETWKAANHYSLLGTLQGLWGLGCLENTCKLEDKDLLFWLFGASAE